MRKRRKRRRCVGAFSGSVVGILRRRFAVWIWCWAPTALLRFARARRLDGFPTKDDEWAFVSIGASMLCCQRKQRVEAAEGFNAVALPLLSEVDGLRGCSQRHLFPAAADALLIYRDEDSVFPLVNGTEEIGTGLNPSDLIANLRALLGFMKQIHGSTDSRTPSIRKLPPSNGASSTAAAARDLDGSPLVWSLSTPPEEYKTWRTGGQRSCAPCVGPGVRQRRRGDSPARALHNGSIRRSECDVDWRRCGLLQASFHEFGPHAMATTRCEYSSSRATCCSISLTLTCRDVRRWSSTENSMTARIRFASSSRFSD
jgi:hypothetical protein